MVAGVTLGCVFGVLVVEGLLRALTVAVFVLLPLLNTDCALFSSIDALFAAVMAWKSGFCGLGVDVEAGLGNTGGSGGDGVRTDVVLVLVTSDTVVMLVAVLAGQATIMAVSWDFLVVLEFARNSLAGVGGGIDEPSSVGVASLAFSVSFS